MAASVTHFVAFEVGGIDTLGRFRFLADFRHGSLIAVLRMETIIHVAPEVGRAVKPWADANEDAVVKPFRTVVAGGSTGVGSNVIVTVRTFGGYSDVDGNLSLGQASCGGGS
jgi:hypothetical protein